MYVQREGKETKEFLFAQKEKSTVVLGRRPVVASHNDMPSLRGLIEWHRM